MRESGHQRWCCRQYQRAWHGDGRRVGAHQRLVERRPGFTRRGRERRRRWRRGQLRHALYRAERWRRRRRRFRRLRRLSGNGRHRRRWFVRPLRGRLVGSDGVFGVHEQRRWQRWCRRRRRRWWQRRRRRHARRRVRGTGRGWHPPTRVRRRRGRWHWTCWWSGWRCGRRRGRTFGRAVRVPQHHRRRIACGRDVGKCRIGRCGRWAQRSKWSGRHVLELRQRQHGRLLPLSPSASP